MRIALFSDVFYPYISGVCTAVELLAKGLADRGHSVFIIAPEYKKRYREFSYPNVSVVRVSAISVSGLYQNFRLAAPIDPRIVAFVRKKRIDVIHFHTPATIGFQAVLVAKLLGIPLVGTFHTFIADPDYLKYIKVNSAFVQRLVWDYSNMFYNSCDLISSPSLQTKREMMNNRCSRPVKVISNGIDFSRFDNRKADEVRAKYNLPKDKSLLFVGRIGIEKNIPYLLDCFRMVVQKIPEAKLMIVGDGPALGDIKAYVRSLGLKDNVVLRGAIDNAVLVKSGIFGTCRVFVSASVTENQPITVLEAQACGLVCVVIDVKGMPDLVFNNVNGFLVPRNNKRAFAEGVVRLLENKTLYRRMRSATLREIKKHEYRHVMEEWEKTYYDLTKKYKAKHKKREKTAEKYKRMIKRVMEGKLDIDKLKIRGFDIKALKLDEIKFGRPRLSKRDLERFKKRLKIGKAQWERFRKRLKNLGWPK